MNQKVRTLSTFGAIIALVVGAGVWAQTTGSPGTPPVEPSFGPIYPTQNQIVVQPAAPTINISPTPVNVQPANPTITVQPAVPNIVVQPAEPQVQVIVQKEPIQLLSVALWSDFHVGGSISVNVEFIRSITPHTVTIEGVTTVGSVIELAPAGQWYVNETYESLIARLAALQ